MINKYFNEVTTTIADLEIGKIVSIVEYFRKARGEGATIYTLGNGGSGSTASHFAGDLSKACGCRAICLNDSMPSITAWANDADYRVVFERMLETWCKKGDIVFAISGSGKSPNVIRALQLAKSKGVYTIGLTAFDGGQVKTVANLAMVVPVYNMEQAEDLHLMVCHIIKTALEVK